MNVNGITNSVSAYDYSSSSSKDERNTSKSDATQNSKEVSAVYEPSKDAEAKNVTKKYSPNPELISKLKADAEAQTAQLRSLVEKLMLGQGNAIGQADDIWSFLRTGKFTVDAETKAKAQADIAENGYWGVEQTSDRIIDFAKALSGGDPSKIEELREAFKKGFQMATKTWGGALPDISQRTYDATMKKFDKWAEESAIN